MKKLCLLVLCFSVSIVVYCETIQRVILSHEGNLTQYDAAHWQDAFTAAVDGDILYFTPGAFYFGDLTLNKNISLIGAGITETDAFYYPEPNGWGNWVSSIRSVYSGCGTTGESTILIGNNLNIAASVSMEGFYVHAENNDGNQIGINITNNVSNLSIKRCQLITRFSVAEGKTLTNFVLESCMVTILNCGRIVSPTIRNCYICEINAQNQEGITLTNCMFGWLNFANNWTVINSAYYGYEAIYSEPFTNTFINCLYIIDRKAGSSTYTNCYPLEGEPVPQPQTFTKAELLSNSYLGVDGTVVGPLGGSAPLTFKPSQSYVSSSTLNYNSSTKKLNVTMTIKKGE